MCLGPALPAKCTLCSGKVGVPYLASILAGTPLLVGLFSQSLLIIPGMIITLVAYTYWVPLERR
jgi:hypothetical protein